MTILANSSKYAKSEQDSVSHPPNSTAHSSSIIVKENSEHRGGQVLVHYLRDKCMDLFRKKIVEIQQSISASNFTNMRLANFKCVYIFVVSSIFLLW